MFQQLKVISTSTQVFQVLAVYNHTRTYNQGPVGRQKHLKERLTLHSRQSGTANTSSCTYIEWKQQFSVSNLSCLFKDYTMATMLIFAA